VSETMDIADAAEGDIYVDDIGKLWRVTMVVHEPTVTVEEVEGTLYDPNRPTAFHQQLGGLVGIGQNQLALPAEIRRIRRSHFIGDKIWQGWKRIWRKPMQIQRDAAQ
jgi:hypothetical protein